jgi:glutamine amidotransferase
MCGGNPFVTDEPDRLDEANLLILPGVGAFGVAMENLKAHGMDQAIREQGPSIPAPNAVCRATPATLDKSVTSHTKTT